jgi:hypothetical protein
LGLVVYTIGLSLWIIIFQSQRDNPGWLSLRLVSPASMPTYDKIWRTDKFETEI